MRKYIIVLLALVVASSLFAKKDIEPSAFKAGENVCFVGDSITHQGQYLRNIIQFYATRFPSDKINFYNVGISGDTIAYVNRRMQDDVLSLKPQVGVLMIGMNNANFFEKQKFNAWYSNKVQEVRQMYAKNLDEILAKFSAANCKVILFTPSPYDELVKVKPKSLVGKNTELAHFSDSCRRAAYQNGYALVDMWGYMMKLNDDLRKDFPEKSFSGGDRVHPDDFGGFVMMANFIRTMGEAREISNTAIDAKNSMVLRNFNCDISNLVTTSSAVSFDSFEHALPFALRESIELGEKYSGFLKEYNNQFLRVNGLDKGKYALFIDGVNVGEYSSEDFELGINLANNAKTPQWKQSEEIAKACMDFRLKNVLLRKLNATEMWQKLYVFKTFEEKVTHLEKLLKEGKIKHPYIKACAESYIKEKPKQAELYKQARAAFDKIYEAAQLKKHKYELKKID